MTKYEKVSTSSLKCEYISSYGQKRNISFLKTAHWYGLNFLFLFIRPENLNMLYESLVGQCEYTRQPKGSFWCHVIDTKGTILLVILLNKFVLVLFHSHLGMW